ncbi:MAG: hypothetical protein LBS29_04960 [Endomicrobium sp.]|jgi:hypothetical protein|nr:hypothetical protein [Endomicrobium sp.]
MIATERNEKIPSWLKLNIWLSCPYCGGDMVDNENLTVRKCSNNKCKGHMAEKINKLVKWFKIKNIGAKTALSYIEQYNLTSHIEIIPYLFGQKPELYLWEIGELAMIQGYDKVWRKLTGPCRTMSEFLYSHYCPQDLRHYADILLYVSTFFETRVPLVGKVVKVMISGSINNFNNRSDFIAAINKDYGNYVNVIDIGKRKTEVDYLIKEPHTKDHDKTKIALDNDIMIVSSLQFLEKVIAYSAYKEREIKERSLHTNDND